MKKRLPLLLFLILLTGRLSAFAVKDPGKLTVMVYMCGSNLESDHGSATADLEEMTAAEINSGEVSLLVMTGGTDSSGRGFDPTQTMIHEVSGRGIRTVWKEDIRNMGSSNTLTRLLQFGKENYPAENYALILWDHGGGPLEGVCWDELFSLDNLKLAEITAGIEKADLGQKLSWIGFDACLMSSLETAVTLAPYAEYMIASQETEPPSGWNYSFLRNIEKDADGSETGRRIIDAYFEGQEKNHDVLTMACTDLQAAAKAAAAMDEFFGPISSSVSPENFARLSGIRAASTGFGKSVRASGTDGYDLVDAADLISRYMETGGVNTELPDLLASAVIYSRSNEEGANGLSLYHPLVNKSGFLDKWRDEYAKLNFSREYYSYIRAFGTLLTGADLVDWSGLEIIDDGIDEQGHLHYSLQLTEDQYRNFSSGQLFILKRIGEGENRDSYVQVNVSKANVDEHGLLSGEFDRKILYVENNGSLTESMGFMQTEDGLYNFIYAVYSQTPLGFDQTALYYFKSDDSGEYPEILRKRVYDEVTDSFTNRVDLSENDYKYLKILNIHRFLPQPDKNGLIPSFENWEANPDITFGAMFHLPAEWRIRFLEETSDFDDLFAMFQITDAQHNSYCSPLLPVRKLHSDPMTFTEDGTGNKNLDITLTGESVSSSLDSGLNFTMTVTNLSAGELELHMPKYILLNDNRLANFSTQSYNSQISTGGTAELNFRINSLELIRLNEINSVGFTFVVNENGTEKELPIRFSVTGGDISKIVPQIRPLAESIRDGLEVQLLSIDQYIDNGFELVVFVNNGSEKDFDPNFAPLINGFQTDHFPSNDIVPAGMSRSIRLPIRDDIMARGIGDSVLDNTVLAQNVLETHGVSKIEEITLLLRTEKGELDDNTVILRPDIPLDLEHGNYISLGETHFPPEKVSAVREPVILAENDLFSVKLENTLFAKEAVILALELSNKTDHPIELISENGVVNDQMSTGCSFEEDRRNSVILAPNSTKLTSLKITEIQENLSVETFSLTFRIDTQVNASPTVIRLNQPAPFGSEGFIWLIPTEIDVTPALGEAECIEPKIPEFDENGNKILMSPSISLPQNAADYRFWVSSELSEEEAAEISYGMALLVQKADDTHVIPFAITGITRDENGIPGMTLPGLILCAENSPRICLCMNYELNKERLEADILFKPIIITDSYKFLTIDDLHIQLEYAPNRAEFSRLRFSEVPPKDADTNFSWIHYIGYEFDSGKGALDQFTGSGPTVRITNEISLDRETLRFTLRPADEEDNLFILFSFGRKDQTGFSLPLIPYPADLP